MNDKIQNILAKSARFLKTPASEIFKKNSFQWNFSLLSSSSRFSGQSNFFQWKIEPSFIANLLRSFFMLALASILLWFLLNCFQYPKPPIISSQMNYYEMGLKNDPSHLFSKKIVHLDGIKIQGIMLTNNLPENPQGYVIFDIDGKNVGPIEVGETFGKGLFLQAITKNSATISYQGQTSNIFLYPEENLSSEKK